MDNISFALYIEDLRNVICDYLNIEDVVNLYIMLKISLPINYAQGIMLKYKEYKDLYLNTKDEHNKLLNKRNKTVKCDICNYESIKDLIRSCDFCMAKICEVCRLVHHSYKYDEYDDYVRYLGYICRKCAKRIKYE